MKMIKAWLMALSMLISGDASEAKELQGDDRVQLAKAWFTMLQCMSIPLFALCIWDGQWKTLIGVIGIAVGILNIIAFEFIKREVIKNTVSQKTPEDKSS